MKRPDESGMTGREKQEECGEKAIGRNQIRAQLMSLKEMPNLSKLNKFSKLSGGADSGPAIKELIYPACFLFADPSYPARRCCLAG